MRSIRRPKSGGSLGTFAGVFTPSILTILGLVLFLRTGYVVGAAGLSGSLVILLLAVLIAVLTSISLSAIATNLRVGAGGDYYLISRTLGLEYGGALGIVLFLAQSVSVAFYAIGFAEITAVTLGLEHAWAERGIAWGAVALLFIPAWLGSDWATRFQYIVMTILVIALAAFFIGGIGRWDAAQLQANLSPAGEIPFWVLFAIFFPAITGFTQGVSMSGDLKDASASLPLGTFLAVGTALIVYTGAMLMLAGAIPGAALVDNPQAMRTIAPYSWLVDAGVIAATLSSALASFLGAPRILQALAKDRIFSWLTPFSKGAGKADNPRRGVLLTLVIAALIIVLGNLNLVAAMVTMFFLVSYGLLNYATYAEARANSPHFRPRFKYFNAWLSLAGALACLGVMLAISPMTGFVAVTVLFVVHQYLSRRAQESPGRFADSVRSHRLQRVRTELHAITEREEHARDWRPVILAFSDDPGRRARLLRFAYWLEGNAGFTTLVKMLEGEGARILKRREDTQKKLREEISEAKLDAFARVVAARDTRQALPVLLQAHGVGGISTNTVLLNWFGRADQAEDSIALRSYGENLRIALMNGCNIVLLAAGKNEFERIEKIEKDERRIDVWYRENATGNCTLMLAYLMTRNDPWKDARLRLLVEQGKNPRKRARDINAMLEDVRIKAQTKLVERFDEQALLKHSQDAAAVFMPFRLGARGPKCVFGEELETMLEEMPLAALVLAAHDVDLEADPEQREGKGKG